MESVVVTGVGAVTPLGVGARTLHERWSAGVCGIRDGEGTCADFDPADFLSVKEARRADRFTQLALAAGAEALADAGWEDELPYDPATCRLRVRDGDRRHIDAARQSGRAPRAASAGVSPLAVPLMMSNAAAAAISLRHGLRGPCLRSAPHAPRAHTRWLRTADDPEWRGRRRRCGRRRRASRRWRGRRSRRSRRLAERHLAPVRHAPGRLRDGRGRRCARARGRRGRARARRSAARCDPRVWRELRRPPPHGPARGRPRAGDGDPRRSPTPARTRARSTT